MSVTWLTEQGAQLRVGVSACVPVHDCECGHKCVCAAGDTLAVLHPRGLPALASPGRHSFGWRCCPASELHLLWQLGTWVSPLQEGRKQVPHSRPKEVVPFAKYSVPGDVSSSWGPEPSTWGGQSGTQSSARTSSPCRHCQATQSITVILGITQLQVWDGGAILGTGCHLASFLPYESKPSLWSKQTLPKKLDR